MSTPLSAPPLHLRSYTHHQLHALLAQACGHYHSDGSNEAHRFILAFQQAPFPYDYVLHVLSHPHAHIHSPTPGTNDSDSSSLIVMCALLTMKSALQREWNLVEKDVKIQCLSSLLSLLSHPASPPLPPFVSRQASHVWSIIVKRMWSDNASDSEQYVRHTLAELLSSSPHSHSGAITVGLSLCQSLLAEFGLHGQSAIGLSVDHHIRAHASFEAMLLVEVFHHCLTILSHLSHTNSGNNGGKVKLSVCAVIEDVLSWEFNVNTDTILRSMSTADTHTDTTIVTSTATVTPPLSWAQLLCQSSLVESLTFLSLDDRRLRIPVWHCLSQLASIKGPIFTQSPSLLTQHVDTLMRAMTAYVSVRENGGHSDSVDESELDVLSTTMCRVIHTYGHHTLVQCSHYHPYLASLSSLTQSIVSHKSFRSFDFVSDTNTSRAQALETLISTWATLLTDSDTDTGSSITNCCHFTDAIFSAYMNNRLQRSDRRSVDVSDSDEQFYGYDNEDETFQSLAILARGNPTHTVSTYHSLLQSIYQQWLSASSNDTDGDSVSYSLHEHSWFVLRLLMLILTDCHEGETPVIPTAFLTSATSVPIKPMIGVLLQWMEQISRMLERHRYHCLSSLVTATLSLLVHRLSLTYLLPSLSLYTESQKSTVLTLSFNSEEAKTFLSVSLSFIVHCLLDYHSELDVVRQALDLLRALMDDRAKRGMLIESQHYQRIVNAYQAIGDTMPSDNVSGGDSVTLTSLPPLLWAKLVSCVVSGCDSSQHYQWLLTPLHSRSRHILSLSQSLSPSLYEHVTATVYALKGLSDATVDYLFEECFALLIALLQPLTHWLAAVANSGSSSGLMTGVLLLYHSMAQHQLAFMSRQQGHEFLTLAISTVQAYNTNTITSTHPHTSASNIVSNSDSDEDDRDSDDISDFQLIVELLAYLISGDLQCFTADSVEAAGQACFLSLSSLLQHPVLKQMNFAVNQKLLILYFHLLQDGVTTYTRLFLLLNPPLQQSLFALMYQSLTASAAVMVPIVVQRKCLQCLSSIAAFRVKHSSVDDSDGALVSDSTISEIQRVVLQCLFYAPLDSALVDACSDALLPALLINSHSYQQWAYTVLTDWQANALARTPAGSCESEAVLTKLMAGLHQLLQDAAPRAGSRETRLSIQHKQRFRQSVRQWVESIRILIQFK